MNAIIIFLQMGKFACCEAMRFAREFGACPPLREFGAFWCIFGTDFVFKTFQKLPFSISCTFDMLAIQRTAS